jgi:hypothetical protein
MEKPTTHEIASQFVQANIYPGTFRIMQLSHVARIAEDLETGSSALYEGALTVSVDVATSAKRISVWDRRNPAEAHHTVIELGYSDYFTPPCIRATLETQYAASGNRWDTTRTFSSAPHSDNTFSLHGVAKTLRSAKRVQASVQK